MPTSSKSTDQRAAEKLLRARIKASGRGGRFVDPSKERRVTIDSLLDVHTLYHQQKGNRDSLTCRLEPLRRHLGHERAVTVDGERIAKYTALYRKLVARTIARLGSYFMYLRSPEQPRVDGAGRVRTARHYLSLSRTLPRMRRLIEMLKSTGGSFMTARDYVERIVAPAAPALREEGS